MRMKCLSASIRPAERDAKKGFEEWSREKNALELANLVS